MFVFLFRHWLAALFVTSIRALRAADFGASGSCAAITAVTALVATPAGALYAGEEGAPAPDPERVRTGRLVHQTYCASCHGTRGEGAPDRAAAGQTSRAFRVAPRCGRTYLKHADGMLYRIVKDGRRDPFNKTERLTMPAFGQTLSPKEIRAVIDYLKTLWTPEHRRFQWDESQRNPFPPEAQ